MKASATSTSRKRGTPRPAPLASPDGAPVKSFANAVKFEQWLARNHDRSMALWLRIFKKASNRPTITYAEALDVALCHGWIDGQKRKGDAESWLQRFTPRKPRSLWSRINTGHIERLTREGRMQPAGHAAVQAAKADGRWAAAYGSGRDFEVPEDFMRAVGQSVRAAENFSKLSRSRRYGIYFQLTHAKRPETRKKRFELYLHMLKTGQKFGL